MKKFELYLFGLLSLSIWMQSCSLQQRRYTGGFNIHWPSVGLSQRKISANVPHQKASNTEAGYRCIEEKSAASLSEKLTNPDTNRISQAPSSLAISSDTSKTSEAEQKIDRKIKITNRLLLGDLISIPLAAATDVEQNLNGLIYIILIAIPLLIYLLFARMSQGVKRRRLKNKTATHSQSNRTGAFYTAEKNLRIESQEPAPADLHDGRKSSNWGFFLSIVGLLALPILGPLYISPVAFVLSLFGLLNSRPNTNTRRRAIWGAFLSYVGLAFATIIFALISYAYIDLLVLSLFTMIVLPLLLYLTVKAMVKKSNNRKPLQQS